jgi:UDP-N-acetyl-D-mannosaminuronic acid dehydrogenase
MKKKVICVIGLGYIGLPTAALLASYGHTVVGVDVNKQVVETINQGKIHIVEPDLAAYVRSAVSEGRLTARSEPVAADVFIICVPTPFVAGTDIPQPNIEHVLAATRAIVKLVKPGNIVILESTSPVGTTHKIAETLQGAGVSMVDVHLAYCPERVLPGKIMTELVGNDRIVGGFTDEATRLVGEFYRSFVSGAVLETDAKTAEMCKLTENSFRDVNIAFANELSMICDREGIDVWRLIQLANRHPRVNILQPGAGVGGHCIAVDPWFVVARDPENAKIIRCGREINDYKTQWVIDKIKAAVADVAVKSNRKPRIACLGLAFKPDIDDLRESPAIRIVETLQSGGYDIVAVEPNIEEHRTIKLADFDGALAEADVVVLLVKHRSFCTDYARDKLRGMRSLDFIGLLS